MVFVDHAEVLTRHDDRAALASLLDDLAVARHERAVVLAVRDFAAVADLLPSRTRRLSLQPRIREGSLL